MASQRGWYGSVFQSFHTQPRTTGVSQIYRCSDGGEIVRPSKRRNAAVIREGDMKQTPGRIGMGDSILNCRVIVDGTARDVNVSYKVIYMMD
jgi:hypothetical protein